MPKLELHYFDFPGGRGEAARLALAIGGVPFEDRRVPVNEWPDMRDRTPLHALPLLEVDGEAITQSNAINRYVGKLADLYPEDPLSALRCDEVLDAVEDIVTQVVATFGIEDPVELKRLRAELVEGPMALYLQWFDALLRARGGRYFVEDRLTVADLKVYVWVQNLRSGVLDHVPVDLCDVQAPKLVEHHARVHAHPGVVAYYEGS